MENQVLKEGAPGSVGMDPVRVNRLRELAASWVKRGDTPSLAILVARRGTIVLHEAFGVRHHEDTTPTLKPDSIFPVASCTKPITASLVMCLVEDGLIGLNRPFIEYVPELDVPGVQWLEEARVADLLCHTSGIDDIAMGQHIAAAERNAPQLPPPAPGQHPWLARRIRLAAGAPLMYRPGTASMYSSFAFNLLGDIARRVSGQPFWQFAHERLFAPLQMRDTFFKLPTSLRDRRVFRVPGYPGSQAVAGLHDGTNTAEFDALDLGAFGIASTARDLAIFLQMLLAGGRAGVRRVLSPASVAAMLRPQVDPSIPCFVPFIDPATGERRTVEFAGSGYGFGMFLYGARDRYFHNGSTASLSAFGHGGFASSYMWADPAYELIGVHLVVAPRIYRNSGDPDSNSDLFMNAVYGAIAE
jgi:serine-type D-Ala-D-Ala carboxypeptidase